MQQNIGTDTLLEAVQSYSSTRRTVELLKPPHWQLFERMHTAEDALPYRPASAAERKIAMETAANGLLLPSGPSLSEAFEFVSPVVRAMAWRLLNYRRHGWST